MSKKVLLPILLSLLIVTTMLPSVAAAQQGSTQTNAKPYHDGPIWDITFVRVKAGMQDRYLRFLTQEWKQEQEAFKKAGYTLDYKVIATEPHGTEDFDVILMIQFKDLATMEANSEKMEATALQLAGGMPKVESGYEQRSNYREIVADRLGREIVLTPKGTAATGQ